MTQVQVDQDLLQKLGGLVEPVELRDAGGQVVGRCLPEAQYLKMLYASFKLEISDEELARIRTEEGGSTLEEIWRELGVR